MLYGLDLFSGYGGAEDALAGYIRTVAYCEIEPGAQRILLRRMRKGQIATAPIWNDVCTLQGRHFLCPIDAITGGWPCTNHSVAGDFTGLEGKESALFKEIIRIAGELQPAILYLENVPGVFVTGFGAVLGKLAAAGFDVEWGCLSAAAMGAPHVRERVWILAYSDSNRIRLESVGLGRRSDSRIAANNCETLLSNANGDRREWPTLSEPEKWFEDRVSSRSCEAFLSDAVGVGSGSRQSCQELWGRFPNPKLACSENWPGEIPVPAICSRTYGPADRRAGVRAGGGGWVPHTAREAFKRLMGLDAII